MEAQAAVRRTDVSRPKHCHLISDPPTCTTQAKLEPFLLVAKGLRGAATAKAIEQATTAVRAHSYPCSVKARV
jgi:hypothetical protein